jgi:hypothetical protein
MAARIKAGFSAGVVAVASVAVDSAGWVVAAGIVAGTIVGAEKDRWQPTSVHTSSMTPGIHFLFIAPYLYQDVGISVTRKCGSSVANVRQIKGKKGEKYEG